MSIKGFTRNFEPLRLLSEEQCKTIHRSTLDVLENVGLRIEHNRAREVFEKNGCKVNHQDNRVKFPPNLVEDCLRKSPSSFRLRARDPKNDLTIGGNKVFFGPAPGKQIVDLDTWEPREPTEKDVYNGLKILDYLPNIHFLAAYTPHFGFEPVPPVMRIPAICAAKIKGSSKWFFEGYAHDCEIFVIQMAQAVNMEVMMSILASSPLTYYREAMECAFRTAEAGMPARVLPGGTFGSSTPATIAGATVTANAEVMGGIVLLQLIRPGMRIEVKDFTFAQNMRTGSPAFGNVQTALHGMVFNQMWQWYGIPVGMTTAYPNAKVSDAQLAYEKALIALSATLSGVNLLLMQGAIMGELTFHPVQAIIDDEMVGAIGRLLEGVQVNEETLALDLIEKVGPIPGEYLSSKHTRDWWQKESYFWQIADMTTYPEWLKGGKKTVLDFAKQKMEQILATHEVAPLSDSQETDITKIMADATKFYKKKGLI